MESDSKFTFGLLGFVGGLLFIVGGLSGFYGSIGEQDIYSFSYRGQPSAVVRVDRRWSPDTDYIRIGDKIKGNQVIREGTIITDDGKEITVNSTTGRRVLSYYSIRDANK